MFKKVQAIVSFVFMALVITSAFGSTQLGYGNTRCSIYNAVQEENGVLVSNINSWTLGYLSGLNHAAAASGKSDRLERQQPDRIAGYIRAYCESKTDDTVENAVTSYWAASVSK